MTTHSRVNIASLTGSNSSKNKKIKIENMRKQMSTEWACGSFDLLKGSEYDQNTMYKTQIINFLKRKNLGAHMCCGCLAGSKCVCQEIIHYRINSSGTLCYMQSWLKPVSVNITRPL